PFGQRRTTVEDRFERREIPLLDVRLACHALEHDGDTAKSVDSMPLDELEGEISDEPLHEDDLLRSEQPELQHVEPVGMVERRRHQLDLSVMVPEKLT